MAFLVPPVQKATDLNHGLFLHQEWRFKFSAIEMQINIKPAIRFDHMKLENEEVNLVEKQWSPSLDFYSAWGKSSLVYLKGNYSRSFRAPTFSDLFYQDVRIEGKPDLLPEKSKNISGGLGLKWQALGNWSTDFTGFRYTIEDLIVWKMGSFEVFRPFNTHAEITGQEYQFSYSIPQQWLSWGASLTHLEPLNKNTNETTYNRILPYRPKTSLKIFLETSYKKLNGYIQYRYIGKRFVNEANTQSMPAYDLTDIHLSLKQKIKKIELGFKLSLLNCFNESYEIIRDMPLPGREWRLGLKVTY